MPNRSRRPCKYPACSNLVTTGYCDKHRDAAKQRRRDEQNADPLRPFYKNSLWASVRMIVMAEEPICTKCGHAASAVVHHIVDARVWISRGGDFYDRSNLTAWCKRCHDRHTAMTRGFAVAAE